jgi:hypothetical protein
MIIDTSAIDNSTSVTILDTVFNGDIIATLTCHANTKNLCWLVNIPIDAKRLVRISLYPSKIDLAIVISPKNLMFS